MALMGSWKEAGLGSPSLQEPGPAGTGAPDTVAASGLPALQPFLCNVGCRHK